MELFAGVIALGLLSMLIYLLWSAMKDGWYLLLHNFGLQKLFFKSSEMDAVQTYLIKFKYYQSLSEEGKKKFISRLVTFMLNKEFVGASGLEVTDEMRVLISAAAIQLTFGLKKYKISSLETITLFNDTFYLNKRSPEYKGATKGHQMYLSWKAFKEGFDISDDKVNLGLHEMTHALKLTLILNEGYDSLFSNRIEYWENLVTEIFKRPNPGSFSFLRSYSTASTEEFFAVCVEAFFENPKGFQKELPEIYQLLVFLLNQDPLNELNDYKVGEHYFDNNVYNIPLPNEVKRSYKYSTSHWSSYLLIIGCMGTIPTFGFLMSKFILPYSGYILILFLFGSIGLLQRRYFFERSILSGRYFVMYAFGGFGATFFILIMWLNFLLPVSDVHAEKHKVMGWHEVYNYGRGGRTFVGYRIELDSELQFNNQVLTLKNEPQHGQKYITFEYRRGLFGIKVVKDYYYSDE